MESVSLTTVRLLRGSEQPTKVCLSLNWENGQVSKLWLLGIQGLLDGVKCDFSHFLVHSLTRFIAFYLCPYCLYIAMLNIVTAAGECDNFFYHSEFTVYSFNIWRSLVVWYDPKLYFCKLLMRLICINRCLHIPVQWTCISSVKYWCSGTEMCGLSG